ncbi:DNA-directed RNA polymerase I subunit RPA43-like [Trichogramma pretiosum]|uniref:DNA-directed RNA polymerase I subunit RPA43-like n=1 Tax=Trichogramma pretiosum TaxID=7493 RepID=UPI000C71B31E|nr:DNA-directed RNA polymerase I subunit RPA43-like [Trichogramma pretiosum]
MPTHHKKKLLGKVERVQSDLWKDEELKELVEMENTCVHLVRTKKQIPMRPLQWEKVDSNIKLLMDSFLYRFDKELGGWLVAYRSIRVMSRFGLVMWDEVKQFHPQLVKIEIEGDFYVFKPEVGKRLTGVIKKVLAYQLEVEALKGFRVTLPKFFADTVEWTGNRLIKDHIISFTIDHINTHMNPYIRGIVIKRMINR